MLETGEGGKIEIRGKGRRFGLKDLFDQGSAVYNPKEAIQIEWSRSRNSLNSSITNAVLFERDKQTFDASNIIIKGDSRNLYTLSITRQKTVGEKSTTAERGEITKQSKSQKKTYMGISKDKAAIHPGCMRCIGCF